MKSYQIRANKFTKAIIIPIFIFEVGTPAPQTSYSFVSIALKIFTCYVFSSIC